MAVVLALTGRFGLRTGEALCLRRHAPGSVKVHLKYGRLTLHDVKKAVDSLDSGCVRKGASLKS
ncbi:unnamed protein product, partial [Effrenium voratum]